MYVQTFRLYGLLGLKIIPREYSTDRTCARDHLLPLKIKTTSVGHVAGAHTM